MFYSALLVRQRKYLINALQSSCRILKNNASDSGGVVDYRNWQLSMGRRFRSLKVWFVLRSFGRTGIQKHIRSHISMAQEFSGWLESRPDLFEILAAPAFAVNVFSVAESAAHRHEVTQDRCTKILVQVVNNSGKAWISDTVIDGQQAIRVVSANTKAELPWLRMLFEFLVTAIESI